MGDRVMRGKVWRVLEAATGEGSLEENLAIGSDRIWQRAIDLGVEATLYTVCKGAGIGAPAMMKDRWRWHVVETMARRRDLLEVYAHLDEAVGRVLVLKGEPLAKVLYGDGYARRSGDVDVLCAPQDVEQAWRSLIARGCRPLHDERPRPWLYNQWACAWPGSDRVVELHWGLSAPEIGEPCFEALYERSEEVEMGGGERVRVLGRGDQLLHASYHFHHHMGFFKGLLDVAAWTDRFAGGEQEVLAVARAHGVEEVLRWPLWALEALSGGEIWRGTRGGIVARVLGAWTARAVSGAMVRSGVEKYLDFKTMGVSQEEVVLWRLLGLSLVEGGLCKGMRVVWRSPDMMRMERGGARVEREDWARWARRMIWRGESRFSSRER